MNKNTLEKVYLKLNLAQSTKQERSFNSIDRHNFQYFYLLNL